jgi:hypothetical protein
LLENNIKGLVIDLRLNGGGSISPMILGVEQLLGDRIVTASQTGTTSINVSIKNNALYLWNPINEVAEIGVATACAKDRNGTVYRNAIQPDIYKNAIIK